MSDNSDLFDPSDEDETCEWCGEDLASDGACADDTCDGGNPDDPDERNEYRGPGCNATCGC